MISSRLNLSARLCAVLLAAGLTHGGASAHSVLKSASPASGSVLPASPEKVVLTFNEAARLTAVSVEHAGTAARKLNFAPSGSAGVFTLSAPALANGRNEIKWKALSKDGHPIDGTVTITITPGSTASAPAPASGHAHHN